MHAILSFLQTTCYVFANYMDNIATKCNQNWNNSSNKIRNFGGFFVQIWFGQIMHWAESLSWFWPLYPSLHLTSLHSLNHIWPDANSECHYIDVIMGATVSQITSLTIVYFTIYPGEDQIKHQSSASPAFVWGLTGDWWIPRTKGQLRGRCFHLMTSSWLKIKFMGWSTMLSP